MPAWATRAQAGVSFGGCVQHGRFQLNAGVRLAAEELTRTGAADELPGVDHGFATRQNRFRHASDLDSFEHGVVNAHVMRLRADHLLLVGIEDDNVGVGTHGDRALPREETEELGGRGGDDFYEPIGRETFAVNSTGVDQAQAMLDAGPAVRNLGEIVFAKLLLLLETKRVRANLAYF